jgi:hypothetical protein
MPAWVVVLLFLGAFICGFLGKAGLDRMHRNQREETDRIREPGTLLFGQEEDIFSAREWLKKSQFCYDEVDAPTLPREGNFRFLLALSKNDVDNLLLCSAARQRYGSIKTAARVSDTVYLPVFKEAGIDYILPGSGDTEIMELLNHVHPRA